MNWRHFPTCAQDIALSRENKTGLLATKQNATRVNSNYPGIQKQ